MFICELCEYKTHEKGNYAKHLTTYKHRSKMGNKKDDSLGTTLEDSKKDVSLGTRIPLESQKILDIKDNIESNKDDNIEYKCDVCNKIFATSSNLSRHMKKTHDDTNIQLKYKKELELIQKDHENELLLAKIQELNKLYEKEHQINRNLEKDNKYLKTLINNAGLIIKSSMSTMSYLMTNYTNAPVLKALNDYSVIEHDDNNDEFDLMDTLILHHDNGTLDRYIGDFIVKIYKKEDPSQQAIWNSDSVRLTYVIREIIDQNPEWKMDKKGVSTKKYIIDPLLRYISKIVIDYMHNSQLENYLHESNRKLKIRMEKLESATKILYNINNKFLAADVLKYIAPHFYLNKIDQLTET